MLHSFYWAIASTAHILLRFNGHFSFFSSQSRLVSTFCRRVFLLVAARALLKPFLFFSFFHFSFFGIFDLALNFQQMGSSCRSCRWLRLFVVVLLLGFLVCTSFCRAQDDSEPDDEITAVYIVTLKQAPSVHRFAQELRRGNKNHGFHKKNGTSGRLSRLNNPRYWIFTITIIFLVFKWLNNWTNALNAVYYL